jgi:hypothetical protein
MIDRWCNGSTADFGSACLGSNPGRSTTAKQKPLYLNEMRGFFLAGGLIRGLFVKILEDPIPLVDIERYFVLPPDWRMVDRLSHLLYFNFISFSLAWILSMFGLQIHSWACKVALLGSYCIMQFVRPHVNSFDPSL